LTRPLTLKAQALAPVGAEAGEPARALFHDIAHPVEGLEVVLQRGPAEQPDLGDVGRAHARLAAFAFDALDHRGLFAADVGPRAAPQLDQGQRAGRVGLQFGQLGLQHGARTVVFVAQVDVEAPTPTA
jgi:hypothetical protein